MAELASMAQFVAIWLASVYGLLVPAASILVMLAALAFCWGLAKYFGLNIVVLLLGRASNLRRGAVLALNSTVNYTDTLVGARLLGAAHERGGFISVAPLAAGCLAGALMLTLTAWAGQSLDRAETAVCPSKRLETV